MNDKVKAAMEFARATAELHEDCACDYCKWFKVVFSVAQLADKLAEALDECLKLQPRRINDETQIKLEKHAAILYIYDAIGMEATNDTQTQNAKTQNANTRKA